ncbi:hypothetical protein ES705_37963 [subsurface metagenome]
MGKLVSFLYKLARAANDISKVSSGNPKKIARRAKNKIIATPVHTYNPVFPNSLYDRIIPKNVKITKPIHKLSLNILFSPFF